MADENDKDQKTNANAPNISSNPSHTELSEDDLSKVAGGAPRDPQSGLPTGQR